MLHSMPDLCGNCHLGARNLLPLSASEEQVVLKAELTAERQQTSDPDTSSHPH